MNTKLKRLTFTNFRSFRGPVSIDFPDRGLVLIRGKNLDNPGVSSGTGKSNILMALAHAFGCAPYPATELQSWLTEEPLSVKVELEAEKGTALLTKGTRSSIEYDGTKVTASAYSDRLKEIVGMDTDLLEALTYRPQQERGLFLSKSNGEMQEFLTTLLGLRKFEQTIEEAEANVKVLEGKYAAAKLGVESAQNRYDDLNSATIPEPHDIGAMERICDVTKEEAEDAASHVNQLKQELSAMVAERDRKILDTKQRGGEAVQSAQTLQTYKYDDSKLIELQGLLDEANKRLTSFTKADADKKKKLNQERDEIKRKINVEKSAWAEAEPLRDSLCPRCNQPWTTPEAKVALDKAEGAMERLQGLQGQLTYVETLIATPDAQVVAFTVGIGTLRESIAEETANKQAALALHKKEKDNEIQGIHLEVARTVEQIRKNYEPQIEAQRRAVEIANNAHLDATTRWTENRSNLATAKKRNEEIQHQVAEHERRLAVVKESLESAKGQMESIKIALDAERDFVEMTKGFLTAIFDEVLLEIASNANDMLANVPNVSHARIKFKTESVTAKGTIKRAICPLIHIHGVDRPVKSALSGGMLVVVELAVDLAVRKVISARTGSSPGWLILDECFEGLGSVEKEATMQLLTQAAQEALILVVDHSSEFKELFNLFVDVEFSNGHSQIASTTL